VTVRRAQHFGDDKNIHVDEFLSILLQCRELIPYILKPKQEDFVVKMDERISRSLKLFITRRIE
jgi:hypothetical protein